MCIIAVAKTRRITEEEFRKCFDTNSDGFGMAWRSNNKVYYQKGIMNADDAWEFYSRKKIDGIHVLHFRIGTSGGKTKEMTHPFLITKDSKLCLSYSGKDSVLFHNGVISKWEDDFLMNIISSGVTPIGACSDTRALAIQVANLGLDEINDKWDKYVTFSPTETLLWGRWEFEDGALFSNRGFAGYKRYSR